MQLYLIDSSIFIFKAWYARKQNLLNARGQANHAFIGFTDFVYRFLTERVPEKLVFTFDQRQKNSQRKEIYPGYKSNRKRTPSELNRQFAWCKRWVELLGITTATSDSWEADDIIGTLAKLHRSPQLSIVILSADKDLTQLIREGDLWWSFLDDKKLDYRAITKKFGVKPEQVSEQLALAGDRVDNIPGIPRVGLNTAANLLRKFGTIDNLRQNLPLVSGMNFRYASHVQQSLIKHQSNLDISSQLTRINCDLEDMQSVDINRGPPEHAPLQRMMRDHLMDEVRISKWLEYLETRKALNHVRQNSFVQQAIPGVMPVYPGSGEEDAS